MPTNITFRSHLLGSITDFSESCGMGEICRPSILVELIVALSRYREEGAKLTPDVYVCENIDMASKIIPDSEVVKIGEVDLGEASVKEVLKKTAPVAIEGWRIYLEQNGNKIRYGLFRDSLYPLAVPVENVLLSTGPEGLNIIRIHQTAEGCVEIRNNRGSIHNIIMSHMKETGPAPTKNLDDLVESICENVVGDDSESIKTFMKKTVASALASSHGTLVAVASTPKVPFFLGDSVPLIPPIDFPEIVANVLKGIIPAHALMAQASLLKGMMNCDGIVLFDRTAKLLAYNCFITSLPASKGPSGGARRRAFEGLASKLNKGIAAAFIQSQDGWSDFRKVTK